METRHGIKCRQLHIEDYLREIPAEQGRETGVYAHEWITGNPDTRYGLLDGQPALIPFLGATILMPHTRK